MKLKYTYTMLLTSAALSLQAAQGAIAVNIINSVDPDDDATLADFQIADSALAIGTPVTTAAGIAGFGALTVSDGIISLTTANSTTFFTEGDATTVNNGVTSGVPILDESVFVRSNRTGYDPNALPTINFTGLSGVDVGESIILTLYGAGGVAGEQAQFIATYAGVDTTLATVYETANFVQFTVVADGVNDTLSVTVDRDPNNDVRGFLNGFSLSAGAVPEPSTTLLGGLGLLGLLRRRRA